MVMGRKMNLGHWWMVGGIAFVAGMAFIGSSSANMPSITP
jgi:hypothetical protein